MTEHDARRLLCEFASRLFLYRRASRLFVLRSEDAVTFETMKDIINTLAREWQKVKE